MNTFKLKNFIQEWHVEFHWETDSNNNRDVILFPSIHYLDEFNKMLPESLLDEGIHCVLKKNYVCFWMREICDYFDIDLEEVFGKDNGN